MESAQPYILSRDDIRLFLRPTGTHNRWQRVFDMRLSVLGLIGASLIYASALIPALIRYQTSNTIYQPRLPIIVDNNALAAKEEDSTPQEISPETVNAGLLMPNLGINAPVVWDVKYNEEEIQTNLKNGLVHLNGSPRPGEKGTIIIVGHSSNFAWAKGDYKTVLAPLLKANLDDKITLNFSGQDFVYLVSQVYEVEPTRIDLLQSQNDVSLRLITCTPLGSTRKRLIVEAIQISPESNLNSDFTGTRINASEIIAAR